MFIPPPFAEQLELDVPLAAAPQLTIDRALAAHYLAIVGDQLALALSDPLSRAVTLSERRLVNPALVLNVAIGQSTVATRRVIANLYYRNVVFARQVHIGESLTTVVTPVAVEWTRVGTERAKVLLDIAVSSSEGDEVIHFQRLALLPVSEPQRLVVREIPPAAAEPVLESFRFAAPAWDPSGFPDRFALDAGSTLVDPLCDTVSSARELVRLTLNVAAAHRDRRAGIEGQRLVYGGHVVALAQASLSRTVDGLLTVLAWRSCDHVAPAFENDLLETSVTIDRVATIGAGLALVDATVSVRALRSGGDVRVLEWRPVLLVAADDGKA